MKLISNHFLDPASNKNEDHRIPDDPPYSKKSINSRGKKGSPNDSNSPQKVPQPINAFQNQNMQN